MCVNLIIVEIHAIYNLLTHTLFLLGHLGLQIILRPNAPTIKSLPIHDL